jgi:hypothetical protein
LSESYARANDCKNKVACCEKKEKKGKNRKENAIAGSRD